MAEHFKSWRKAGGLLGFVADVLQVLMQNWGLVLSVAIGLGAGLWDTAFRLLNDPHVLTIGRVFLWTLWSYLGVSLLLRVHRGIKVIEEIECIHAVNIEQLFLAFDPTAASSNVQIVAQYRNVSNRAIKLRVEDLRVVLDRRTIQEEDGKGAPFPELIIPRIATKAVRSGPFNREELQERSEGLLDIAIEYGPHDGEFCRKYRHRSRIYVNLGERPGITNHIISEVDSAL
jgi:hypothetical protein